MLRKVITRKVKSAGGRFAIVASEYNAKYVDSMLNGAQTFLTQAGAAEVRVLRVPGAFEVPAVAAKLARQQRPGWDGIVCLGVILRGETTHAQHIGDTVSRLLGQIAVDTGVPVIHEVLLLENTAQADKRCLDPEHNRGAEAAQTALAMAKVMREIK
ncbi:MAG: 6,7-dimethyl-8-ribityllumazine synthase [Verrucomicrobiota bacterium]